MTAIQILQQALILLNTGEQLFAKEAVKCVELRHHVNSNALEMVDVWGETQIGRIETAIDWCKRFNEPYVA